MSTHYSRCFTFGCSITSYKWPTWADVLHHQLDIPVFNYGQAGLGNVGIAHKMLQADITHQFNDNDLILVMWTHWSREDRFIDGQWQAHGNIFKNDFYDHGFIKKYWDWDNDVIKNATAIITANRCFNIADQWSIIDYGAPEYNFELRNKSEWFDRYLPHLPKALDVSTKIHNSQFSKTTKDPHPDILAHIEFYNRFIASKFGTPIVGNQSVFHQAQADMVTGHIVDRVTHPGLFSSTL